MFLQVLRTGRKCFGRRVHATNGRQFSTPYGDDDTQGKDFLLSISRVALNTILLNRAREVNGYDAPSDAFCHSSTCAADDPVPPN